MKIEGQPFSNGENCQGISFVAPDRSHELDVLRIRNEYPEGPFGEVWAINERASIMATLAQGAGRVAVRQVIEGLEKVETIELDKDSAVNIPAGTPYAWQSDDGHFMKVDATFTPPFEPELYHTMTEAEIQLVEALLEVAEEYLDPIDWMFAKECQYEPDGVLSLVYGRLIDEGKDPDAILKDFGILEKGEDN